MGKRLRIRQVRSGIGSPVDQRRTLRALGLRHHQDVVVQEDHPAIRGMARKVAHLVVVEEVKDDG
ncbi:MAG: 50S ribosomal protein L30 [Gemmatimonadota bacterium]